MALFIIGACLAGGLLLLDRWQVGEFGLSQPIVACPLLGLLYGDLGTGFYFGAALQLVWVAALPLGRAQSLDYQGAGVVAVVAHTFLTRVLKPGPDGDGKVVFACLVMASVASFIGAQLDIWNKQANGHLYRRGAKAGSPSRSTGWHLAGLATGFLRGAVLTGAFLGLAALAARPLLLLPRFTRTELLALALGLGLAGAARMFVSLRRLHWTAFGGAVAGLLWVFLRQ